MKSLLSHGGQRIFQPPKKPPVQRTLMESASIRIFLYCSLNLPKNATLGIPLRTKMDRGWGGIYTSEFVQNSPYLHISVSVVRGQACYPTFSLPV